VLFQNQEAQSEILHTRVICLVAVGIGALLLQPPLQAALFGTSAGGLSQYLTSVSVPFYLLFLVYFLMGFFLYATIYAGALLASRVTGGHQSLYCSILPSFACTWPGCQPHEPGYLSNHK
jgi:hypothetical protein